MDRTDGVPVDPRRECPAVYELVFLPDGSAPNGIDRPPGTCQERDPRVGETCPRLMFACPGCGQWGSIRCGHPKPALTPSWDILAGTLSDPPSLTLSPSIFNTGCCGWHGYLVGGRFRMDPPTPEEMAKIRLAAAESG